MNLEKELEIKLNNNFYLDKEQYQVLSMLYKPLVSASALNIYLSIYLIALKKRTISSLFLRDVISSNISIDKIVLKLDQLKEYKLIKYSDSLIELYPPLLKNEFNETGLLNYLKNYCSKDQYNFLLGSVYNEDLIIKKVEDFSLSKLKYKVIKKSPLPFDFNEFINHVDEEKQYLLPYKEKIEAISLLFNYSLNDMLRLVYEVDLNGESDIEKLINKAIQKNSKKNIKHQTSSEEVEFINYFKNKKAEEIMLLVKDTSKSRKADQETIKRLREELNLNEDIISLLVCYSIVTNESKLHPFVFYETIIKDWTENNINNVEEAFAYINKLYKEYKNKTKLSEVSEDWYDQLIKKYKEDKNDR